MAYPINLIQRVSDGDILSADGITFIPITSQASYRNALFIGGDPNTVPDNYSGLPVGDYRVMTFFTHGQAGVNFPVYNNLPFSNFVAQSAGNKVNVLLRTDSNAFPSDSENGFATWSSDWYATGRGPSFLLFTEEQYVTYQLEGAPLWNDGPYFESNPSYAGYYFIDAYPESAGNAFIYAFSRLGNVTITDVSWLVLAGG